ncbi:MAG: preprotein translocase subunit YajC [Gammaproteobacteria bacterium]|nr:MAG: preprotein translocase subunit YajC [Gammaproteobacteria bacterium]
MGFFISDALAAGKGAESILGNPLVLIAGFFLIFYFVLIRPQQKKQKEHRAMIAALSKGDEVATSSGIMGRVTRISDNYITVEVSDGVEMVFQRQAVQTVLPKGTLKSVK